MAADPDDKGRAAAAARLGARSAYADYRAMLEKEKPQIVSVADRHRDGHRDMVVACARAGASVFLEKPMARTLAEADEMVRACETHHVKGAIAHQTRYSPRLAGVKELITSGRLGDLLEMRGRGKEETLEDGGLGQRNGWIARDLIEAIEKDRQPLGSLYAGRAALEMILAVYESHRQKGPVNLPLKERRHPLEVLA